MAGPDLILLYDPSLNMMTEYGPDVMVEHVTGTLSGPNLILLYHHSLNMTSVNKLLPNDVRSNLITTV